MDKGTEVPAAVVFLQACNGKTGDGVIEINLHHDEPFVVFEADVVFGAKLLDEFAFEEEGFGFGFDDMDFHVVNAVEKGFEFEVPAMLAGGVEILAHPFVQIAGFTDINNATQAVLVKVHARFMREVADPTAHPVL